MAKKRRRKMSALQRKYFGKRKRRARAGTVVVATSNPRRRRRSMAKHRRRRRRVYAANPRIRRRRYRRNPMSFSGSGFLNNTLMPAAIGAAGAIGVDYAMNALAPNLPASLQTPTVQPFVRIGAALLLGAAVGAVTDEKTGGEVAAGGVIVTIYQLATQYLAGGYNQQSLMGRMRRRNMMQGAILNRRRALMGAMRRRRMMGRSGAVLRNTRNMRGMAYYGAGRTLSRYGMGRYAQ